MTKQVKKVNSVKAWGIKHKKSGELNCSIFDYKPELTKESRPHYKVIRVLITEVK